MARRPRISNAFLEEQRRLRIMKAAAQLVARRGPRSPSVTAIVSEARVARNTFYETFRSKDHCLREMVEWVGWKSTNSVAEALVYDNRLDAGLDGLLSFIAQHPAEADAYLRWGPAISPDELAKTRQRFASLLSTAPGPREDFVVGAVEQRLYRFFAGEVAPSLVTSLRDELADLIRAVYGAPASASVHELSAPAEPARAAA